MTKQSGTGQGKTDCVQSMKAEQVKTIREDNDAGDT